MELRVMTSLATNVLQIREKLRILIKDPKKTVLQSGRIVVGSYIVRPSQFFENIFSELIVNLIVPLTKCF
jgi:hypothetical protein